MSEKHGFVYIWYDRKHKRFYIGSHWGTETDGYICSSRWMRKSHARRPEDFKRRIIKRIFTNRVDLVTEETRWLNMMKDHELTSRNTTHDERITNVRYYNFNKSADHLWHVHEDRRLTIGEKISAAKIGKSTGPCSPEKAQTISEAKKRKFAERKATLGYTRTPEQVEKHRQAILGKTHTDEWKAAQSVRIKQQWENGTRKSNGDPFKNKTDDKKKAIIDKRIATMTGRKLAPEHRDALSLDWIVTAPTGEEHRVRNLNQFCRDNQLTRANIARVGSRGWKAIKAK